MNLPYNYQPPPMELILTIRTIPVLLQAFKDGLIYFQGVDPGNTTFLHGGCMGCGEDISKAIKRYRDTSLGERAMVEDFLMDHNYSPTEFFSILDQNYSNDPVDYVGLDPLPLWWPDWTLRPDYTPHPPLTEEQKEKLRSKYRTNSYLTTEERDKAYNDDMLICVEEIRQQIRNYPK